METAVIPLSFNFEQWVRSHLEKNRSSRHKLIPLSLTTVNVNNLVLKNLKYCWFYFTFWVVITNGGLKLPKLSIHALLMSQRWIEIHEIHEVLFKNPLILWRERGIFGKTGGDRSSVLHYIPLMKFHFNLSSTRRKRRKTRVDLHQIY